MTDELNDIFETIKYWSVDEIKSIFYHEKWTQRKTAPFKDAGKSQIPPLDSPESFNRFRHSIACKLRQESNDFDDEQNAKIIICSTFLLINDFTIDGRDKIKSLLLQGGVHSKLLELLDEMDSTTQSSDRRIKKLQLFYALSKQRENPEFTVMKITWRNVTSKWGPKVVMSDGQSYYYVFNKFDKFSLFHENYNIAAKLGRTEQYESEYIEEENDLNLKILKVMGTKNCKTLADYFKHEKMGEVKTKPNQKLFVRLSEMFLKNGLEKGLTASSDELKKILPRLSKQNKTYPFLNSILHPEKDWIIPRRKVETNNKVYFVVHGDEWGGNFLVNDYADAVYVIDFEDAIFSNAADPETVLSVGGDLSSRIFNLTKDDSQKFLPIGLSIFASIGRLLAAIIQYHSRYGELEKENIGIVVKNYLKSFERSLEDRDSILKSDYWDEDLEKLILLHAWDWALYWRQKEGSVFPRKHFDEFIQHIRKLLECNITLNARDSINVMQKRKIPNLSESQYNLFNSFMFNIVTPYYGKITDKVFETKLKQLNRIEDPKYQVKYIKDNLLPNCQENRELEYFSLMFIILNSDYNEAKDYYYQMEVVANELAEGSGDDVYIYTAQLIIFNSCSHESDPGKFYDDVVNIPYGPQLSNRFFISSRFLLSNYHLSRGEYPIALDFNIEGGQLFPKTVSKEDSALWWSLYNTRCLLYNAIGDKEKLYTIINELVEMFRVMSLILDENTLFCNSNQFFVLLGEMSDTDNQEIILDHFNNPEFKDELREENLAQLHLWNGERFVRREEFLKSIESFKLAGTYATDSRLKSNALCNIGSSYANLKEYKLAILHVEQAISMDNRELEYWRILLALANWCKESEDYSNALKHFRKASDVNHKLYHSNSLPEHLFYYINAKKSELWLGLDQFKDRYNFYVVYDHLRELLRVGIREFNKTSYRSEFCEKIRDDLIEICTVCSGIDSQFSSSQLNRIEREWRRKQRRRQQEFESTE